MANLKYAPGVRRVIKKPGLFNANHPSELRSVHMLIVATFCGIWNFISMGWALAFAITSVCWVVRGAPKRKISHPDPKTSGDLAEEFTVSMLDGLLNNKHWIARNVRVPNPRSKTGNTEIDVLVVGPRRIWCVEVKNNKGIIEVDPRKPRWNVKCGKAEYEMRDPSRQVLSQKLALETYLKKNGINTKVGTLVYYASPDAMPTGASGFRGIPILRSPGTIASVIKMDTGEVNFRFRKVLSKLKPILKDK